MNTNGYIVTNVKYEYKKKYKIKFIKETKKDGKYVCNFILIIANSQHKE